jgi:subfamily B ATP-binding cassette protein MsbA
VALVGRSGAGKTTLASLIPRFYDVSSGRVLIDGRDVRHYTLKSLRESVSLVTQDALLFSASIRDNLLYARPDATEQMLWQALGLANMREFVEELPGGIDAVIGERGVKISGGQRQRLALARAFLKDSKVVILDEATSAVDSESENLIHEAMERLMEGRTVLLIAHRLRSAINADLIVVLDQGTIVETGVHAELLSRGGVYARMFKEQVRGLDLEAASDRHDAGSTMQA